MHQYISDLDRVEVFKAVHDQLDGEGIEVSLDLDYSGRFMFGKITPALTVAPAQSMNLGATFLYVIIDKLRDLAAADGMKEEEMMGNIPGPCDIGHLMPQRMDSMGLDLVYY